MESAPAPPHGPAAGPGRPGGHTDGAWLIRRAMSLAVTAAARAAVAGRGGPPRELTLLDIGGRGRPYAGVIADLLRPSSVSVRHLVVDPAEGADVPAMAETLPFASRSADLVLCTQVLEHVTDPGRAVSEMARVLKPDGVCLLTTHGTWFYHPDPEDYWRWTPAGLSSLFRSAGFGDVKVTPVGGTKLALAVLALTALERSVGNGLAGALARRLIVAPANLIGDRWLMPRAVTRVSVAGELVINYLVAARPSPPADV